MTQNSTRPILVTALVAVLLVCVWTAWNLPLLPPLPHAAYIWQREWTDGLREAIPRNQPFVAEWVVLAAEVEFRPDAAPRVARVAPDYASLRESRQPTGFVIRVAPRSGPFDPVSYTHLDVYKRQILSMVSLLPLSRISRSNHLVWIRPTMLSGVSR